MRCPSPLSLLVPLCLLFAVACGEPPPEELNCGQHGASHGDHCHCRAGYVEENGTCVPDEHGHGDACGEHGHSHGDHCHCDEGYVEEGGTCVPDEHDHGDDTCGEHGHSHGDHCHCDEGYVEEGGTCVPDDHDHGDDTCGEHGHSHGDHCHCDEGYVEEGGACVPDEAGCGEHGEQHGDHCHCDEGYEEEEGLCVPAADCGEHGHSHGDHCHCDAGYEEENGTCVPSAGAEACGDHGHRHLDACVCEAGFIYSAEAGTCVTWEADASVVLPTYVIVPLSEDGTQSSATAINDTRAVVGNKKTADPSVNLSAYLQLVGADHTPGPVQDVGILSGSTNLFSRPFDVNLHGVVVGESGNSNPVLPFIHTAGDGLQQLPLPAGSDSAVAHGINDAGQIVGIGASRAILWASASATPTALPLMAGATETSSRAWKINAAGDIVGHARNADGRQRAALWPLAGTPTDLGVLNPSYTSEALDVNASRQVVGKSTVGVVPGSEFGTLQTQAFVWENGAMRGLGILETEPDAVHSTALAINDSGWIVGQVEKIAGFAHHAVLWTEGGIVDLNTLLPASSGWVLHSATDINNHGDIVGRGSFEGGPQRPYILIRVD